MSTRYANLPASDVKLREIAVDVLERGQPFSWQGLEPLLDEGSYRDLEQVMLEAGLLRPRSYREQKDLELTPAGRAVLRRYLSKPVSGRSVLPRKYKPPKTRFYDLSGGLVIRNVSRKDLIQHLEEALSSRNACVVPSPEGGLEFWAPWVAFNWHLFAGISFGRIEIQTINSQESKVTYRISMRGTRIWLLISNVSAIPFFASSPMPIVKGPGWLKVLLSVLVYTAISWAWIYGMGRLLVSVRFEIFLDKICRKAYASGKRVPGTTKRVS